MKNCSTGVLFDSTTPMTPKHFGTICTLVLSETLFTRTKTTKWQKLTAQVAENYLRVAMEGVPAFLAGGFKMKHLRARSKSGAAGSGCAAEPCMLMSRQ